MIELNDITVSKSRRKLFENLNFRIKAGEHWVVQGDNGSGKTLLLQLISGAVHPVSGRVSHSFIQEGDWDTLYQQRLEKIHFIPTQWLQAFLSGVDGLFYQQRYYTVDEMNLPTVRDVFGEDIQKLQSFGFSERFDIRNLLDLHLTRLSNGQLKKVVIMRQLVKNIPQFLLLDYPFDGLDAESRNDLSRFIDEIAIKFSIQIVLVDHGPALPAVINKRLTLDNFKVEKIENIRKAKTISEQAKVARQEAGTGQEEFPVVEMKDLTIEYSGKKIISNLNWRINRGDRWALTGRNGSGKTTLFSLIYADHPMAYSQKVFLFGKRRGSGESIWDIKKRINYFGPEQIHFLNPKTILTSGREYILMQAHKDPDKLQALIDFFRAERYIDQPVRHLSSGQLQMVLLINMFLDDKELLLLDEPFQFLDPQNHARVTEYLNHYLDENITLVLITHDEKDVARWTQLRKRL
ncbi:MAG TPA: ATP-binding cassette domain-containing protein [Chryseosolibacter sp.]|nr:ATP-binding cassette domain-containing protein [Chryseosolibacter sp.]